MVAGGVNFDADNDCVLSMLEIVDYNCPQVHNLSAIILHPV